jgi:hypothetical protein
MDRARSTNGENNCLHMSLQWKLLSPLPRKERFQSDFTRPASRHSESVVQVVVT